MQLGEGGIAVGAALAAAQGEGAAGAAARGQAVVDVDVFGAQRGEIETRVLVVEAGPVEGEVGPAFAQHVHRCDQVQVVVELAAAAGDEFQPARVQRIGLFVRGLQAGGVPAVQPGECGHAVLHGRGLALVGVVDLRQRLVSAGIEVAALDAEAEAGAAAGAVVDAGGVDAARCGGEVDLHRHHLVLGVLRLRQDLDQAEIVQRHQRTAQAFQFGVVVGLARGPADQFLQQLVADDGLRRLRERRLAQRVARTAGPAQVDVRGVVGAGDLDPVRGEIGIEIAMPGQRAADLRFAGFVQAVVEHLALARGEAGERGAHAALVAGIAFDADVPAAHAHRLAGFDADADGQRSTAALAGVGVAAGIGIGRRRARIRGRRRIVRAFRHAAVAALDDDGRRVVAERLQRLAGLGFRLAQQVVEPARRQVLADGVVEGERDAHVLRHQLVVEAADIHAGDGNGRGRQRRRAAGEGDQQSHG